MEAFCACCAAMRRAAAITDIGGNLRLIVDIPCHGPQAQIFDEFARRQRVPRAQ